MASQQNNNTLVTLAEHVNAHAQAQQDLYDQIDSAVAQASAQLEQNRQNAGLAAPQAPARAAPEPPPAPEGTRQ